MEAQPKNQLPVAAKLAALAALSRTISGFGLSETSESVGAGTQIDGSSGTDVRRAFYFGGEDLASLGAAVRWAAVQDADELHIVSEVGVGSDIARRSGYLDCGFGISTWSMEGGKFTELEPSILELPPELSDSYHRFTDLIIAAGAKPVDDFGRLVAEVNGLEVARVTEPTEPSNGVEPVNGDAPTPLSESSVVLEIGVGQADRELHQLIHGAIEPLSSDAAESAANEALLARLTKVVTDVAEMRTTGGIDHPLTRVARQRWIRSLVTEDPTLVDAADLVAVPPLRPRETVLGIDAAAAVGTSSEGDPIVVVCSAGVDLDLASEAGDYRHRYNDDAKLIVLAPERDLYLIEPTILDLLSNVVVRPAPAL